MARYYGDLKLMGFETVKSRLRSGEELIGGWLTSGSPVVAEAMATSGFDWIAMDMEHSPADEAVLAPFCMAVERHGVAPFVRLPSADPYLARRALDLGVVGLIIPVVESAENFQEFSRHLHYPPKGCRGVGLSRTNLWGDRFDAYLSTFEPILIPQIETGRGTAEVGAILDLPSVDGVFVGPYDLSADLGHPGDFQTADFTAAVGSILAACAIRNKACGIHQVATDPVALAARRTEGYRFIAYGTDLTAMRYAFKGMKA